ncbi:hypothetical protein TPR58_05815 [Sphingomonas sp. HF-S3]|uniref:Uncharacterized protein n=1 Tax=Sphingomonas rustica TaxID=3103142 RepID=A0ABV0B551_9SPHN
MKLIVRGSLPEGRPFARANPISIIVSASARCRSAWGKTIHDVA